MEKLEIAILSTFFGWFLAQGTEYLRYKSILRRKKKAVTEELTEIKQILEDSSVSALDAALNDKVILNLSSKVEIQTTNQYYDEIAYLFSESNRFNFRYFLIHLKNFNNGIEWFSGYEQGSASSLEIKQKLIEQYKQSLLASFFIKCFLKNDEKITDNHQKMDELRDKVSQNVKKILSNKSKEKEAL